MLLTNSQFTLLRKCYHILVRCHYFQLFKEFPNHFTAKRRTVIIGLSHSECMFHNGRSSRIISLCIRCYYFGIFILSCQQIMKYRCFEHRTIPVNLRHILIRRTDGVFKYIGSGELCHFARQIRHSTDACSIFQSGSCTENQLTTFTDILL